jgi:hypothetical protein
MSMGSMAGVGMGYPTRQGGAAGGLCRSRRTYRPRPLTIKVLQCSGRDNRKDFTPTGVGTTEAKKTEEVAGPATKEHIWIGYRIISGGPKEADR